MFLLSTYLKVFLLVYFQWFVFINLKKEKKGEFVNILVAVLKSGTHAGIAP